MAAQDCQASIYVIIKYQLMRLHPTLVPMHLKKRYNLGVTRARPTRG